MNNVNQTIVNAAWQMGDSLIESAIQVGTVAQKNAHLNLLYEMARYILASKVLNDTKMHKISRSESIGDLIADMDSILETLESCEQEVVNL